MRQPAAVETGNVMALSQSQFHSLIIIIIIIIITIIYKAPLTKKGIIK